MKELHVQNMAQTDQSCSQQIYHDFEMLRNEEAVSQIKIKALTDEVAELKKAKCVCDGQKTITRLNAAVSELEHRLMIAKAKEIEDQARFSLPMTISSDQIKVRASNG